MSIIERIFNRGQKNGREIIDLAPYEAGMTPRQCRDFESAFKEKVGRLSQTSQEYLAEGLRAWMVGKGRELEKRGEALAIEASGRREAVSDFIPTISTVIEGGKAKPHTVERIVDALDKGVEANLRTARETLHERLQVLDRSIQNPPNETQRSVTVREKRKGKSETTLTEISKPILPKHISTGGIDIEYPSATINSGASASVGNANAGVSHRPDGFSVHASSHGNSASAASGESVRINGGSIHVDSMDADY